MAINPAVLQKQAALQAPGQQMAPQSVPPTVAKGRKQTKGGKTPAQTMYSAMATQGVQTP